MTTTTTTTTNTNTNTNTTAPIFKLNLENFSSVQARIAVEFNHVYLAVVNGETDESIAYALEQGLKSMIGNKSYQDGMVNLFNNLQLLAEKGKLVKMIKGIKAFAATKTTVEAEQVKFVFEKVGGYVSAYMKLREVGIM